MELGDLAQLLQQLKALLIHGAADGEGQIHGLAQLGNAHVQAGLDQALDISGPGLDAVGGGADHGDDLGSGLGGQSVAAQSVHVEGLNSCFGLIVLCTDLGLQLLGDIIDALQMGTHGNHVGGTGTGDGVVLGAACKGSQAQGHQILDTAHELAHDLVGVGAVLVDLNAGVAALETINSQTDAGAVDSTALASQGDGSGSTTCAGNGEDALFLGIDVDQGAALQIVQVDDRSAQHANLLVNGDDDFQRRMGNGGVGHQSQSKGNGNAIVAAQSGALGVDIAAIVGDIQALGGHIDGAVGILLADHVHVALDDDGIVILVAAGAILENDHIVGLVLAVAQAVLLGVVHQIVADGLGVAGAMGNGADLLEIFKDSGRLQARQFHFVHINNSFIEG